MITPKPPQQKKFFFLFLGSILFLGIVAALVFFLFRRPAPPVGVPPFFPEAPSSSVVLADLCPRADDREAFLLCLDTIFIPAVIKRQDLALCDQIADEELRENCQDQYITRQAFALQDIARCDNASDPVLCRMIYTVNQAVRQKDSSLCNDVSDAKLRSECKGIIEGTFSPSIVPERK